MTIFGIGPLLACTGVGTALAVIGVQKITGWQLALPAPCDTWLLVVGVLFILIGCYFWLASIILVKRAFATKQLVCRGVYRLSRNPMYAGFIVFILPGIAFVVNNLLLFLIPIAMFLVFTCLIRKEEEFLRRQFGEAFYLYEKEVPQLIPFTKW